MQLDAAWVIPFSVFYCRSGFGLSALPWRSGFGLESPSSGSSVGRCDVGVLRAISIRNLIRLSYFCFDLTSTPA